MRVISDPRCHFLAQAALNGPEWPWDPCLDPPNHKIIGLSYFIFCCELAFLNFVSTASTPPFAILAISHISRLDLIYYNSLEQKVSPEFVSFQTPPITITRQDEQDGQGMSEATYLVDKYASSLSLATAL